MELLKNIFANIEQSEDDNVADHKGKFETENIVQLDVDSQTRISTYENNIAYYKNVLQEILIVLESLKRQDERLKAICLSLQIEKSVAQRRSYYLSKQLEYYSGQRRVQIEAVKYKNNSINFY